MWWLDNRVARTKRKHYHRYHNSISKNTVDPVTEVMYEENPTPDFLKSNKFSYAIVVTGEHPYSETVGDSLNLTIPEPGPTTITNVCGAVKCVVVLISGRPVVIEPYVSFVHALGAMGFGLPAAIGAAVARPDAVVVDIDSDGSFIMNVQELATIGVENLPVKILLLNNQHLGMVVQWEDRIYKANRAHTYLGNPSKESKIFPNMLKFAEACDIPTTRVTRKADLRAAIQKMLDTPGPYLFYVIVPHQEHVLPMIPAGRSFMDVITEVDGRTKY